MHLLTVAFLTSTILVTNVLCSARNTPSGDCVAFAEASKHVGTTQCVSGTVLHVENGTKGVTMLNFCVEAKACPFSVVVFPGDLKKMGDIRQLEGRQIEIRGTIQDYDGRTEIVLHRSQQLGESAFRLFPSVPTDYDVERAGHHSAGKLEAPQSRQEEHCKTGRARFD